MAIFAAMSRPKHTPEPMATSSGLSVALMAWGAQPGCHQEDFHPAAILWNLRSEARDTLEGQRLWRIIIIDPARTECGAGILAGRVHNGGS